MLVSPSRRIAFAHYPKTAGLSVTDWFLKAFPDAVSVRLGRPHMAVARGLLALGEDSVLASASRRLRRHLRFGIDVTPRSCAIRRRSCDARPLRIMGVIRDPFEMVVSLYEYHRRNPSPSRLSLIRAAQTSSFSDFLALGFRRNKFIPYEHFFDVAGPAWGHTRLVAFESLEAGLHEVCREFGIDTVPRLERLNAAPRSQRSLSDYAAEAGPLSDRVRSHFAWYYQQGVRIAVRGANDAVPTTRSVA